ncbi:unnamed protein product [Moneuplotes crassus]|uniref:Uncharacterized protein n=1 Tax=Euplotes crassus TaxID=5936 RepID=A0AAD2CVM3_EUPCR|nr:unnamed protein product [Moneuplotes crassus]
MKRKARKRVLMTDLEVRMFKKAPSCHPRRFRKRSSKFINFECSTPHHINQGMKNMTLESTETGPQIKERTSEFESIMKLNYDANNILQSNQNMFMEIFQKELDHYNEPDFKKTHKSTISHIQSINGSPKKIKKLKNTTNFVAKATPLSTNMFKRTFTSTSPKSSKMRLNKVKSHPILGIPSPLPAPKPKTTEVSKKPEVKESKILKQFSRPRNHAAISKMIKGLYQGLEKAPLLKLKLLHNNKKILNKRQQRPKSVAKTISCATRPITHQGNRLRIKSQARSRNTNFTKSLKLQSQKFLFTCKNITIQ